MNRIERDDTWDIERFWAAKRAQRKKCMANWAAAFTWLAVSVLIVLIWLAWK